MSLALHSHRFLQSTVGEPNVPLRGQRIRPWSSAVAAGERRRLLEEYAIVGGGRGGAEWVRYVTVYSKI